MKKFLIVSGLILSSVLAPVRAIAATFSQIVVYGDSLSDLGRAAAATSTLPAQYKFPTYDNGGGRFSNGPIWVECLANRLGKLPSTRNDPTIAAGLDTLTLLHNTALAASIDSLSQANR